MLSGDNWKAVICFYINAWAKVLAISTTDMGDGIVVVPITS